MFNFTFSFAAALFALPLAAAPVLLHLLFKQKSPVVQFSTLRFIKLSIQRTAARKRIQKWLLLACRALLIALIIWAIAQPAKKLTSAWLSGSGGRSMNAVIVVDTSYSMQLADGQVTLLSKADSIVQDLLRNQLAGAKVAIFRSTPGENAEQLKDASAIIDEWTPLQPQAGPKPLVDRVTAAVAMLNRSSADQKWLVVISDFQSKEFPYPMPAPKDGRTVLLDLHLSEVRTAGITKIAVNPPQPIPGLPMQAMITVTGQANDPRPKPLTLTLKKADPEPNKNPETAFGQHELTLDSTGRGAQPVPLLLPAERWLMLTASLTNDDAMAWDNLRSELIEVPPKQHVSVLQQSVNSQGENLLRLALDPYAGQMKEWPLQVTPAGTATSNEDAVVMDLAHWPDPKQASLLKKFAGAGHTVILFLSPGLEKTWPKLPIAEQADLKELLPSSPLQKPGNSLCRAAVADSSDPLLEGLVDEKYQLNAIVIRQLVPLAAEGNSSIILNAVPADPTIGSRTQGLLFRKSVGQGTCFTCSTAPDSQVTNLVTHPTFLPLLVRMSLKPPAQSAAQNVELGSDLVLEGSEFPANHDLYITNPAGERFKVPMTTQGDFRQFIFADAKTPGLYIWRSENGSVPIAMTNVQLPAEESNLTFRPASSVAPPGPDTLIATSVVDLSKKISDQTAPRPQWSTPLAIVMFLLCLEALMGSWSKEWSPVSLRAFIPGIKSSSSVA